MEGAWRGWARLRPPGRGVPGGGALCAGGLSAWRPVKQVRGPRSRHDPVSVLSVGAGQALGALFGAVARVRGGPVRALHPRGEVRQAMLRRRPGATRSGVAWLDDVGDERVQVRLSRSVGLPTRLPDILGMAVRVPVAGRREGDLLLATTGSGSLGRFVLRPARDPLGAAYTTLLPYRTPSGPLLLAAFPVTSAPPVFQLAWARGTGSWNAFATLEIGGAAGGGSARPVGPLPHPVPRPGAYHLGAGAAQPPHPAPPPAPPR